MSKIRNKKIFIRKSHNFLGGGVILSELVANALLCHSLAYMLINCSPEVILAMPQGPFAPTDSLLKKSSETM